MIRLEVQIQRKAYRSPPTVALEDVRFCVEPGEFVAIVGPSGGGKSTLLNLVAGIDSELEGTIVRGENGSPPEHGTPRVAFVFQQPRLMPWLTVLDNVLLVLEADDEASGRARALLANVGLEEFTDTFPGRLSGGMQRRVALARAFAVGPDLLLLDEPFVSLDEPTAWRLREQLVSLWEAERPTVLYVTHDLREALTLAERVVFLSSRPGRVILDQTIPIERPRRPVDPRVAALQEQLMTAHPELLSGVVGSRPEGARDVGDQPPASPRAAP